MIGPNCLGSVQLPDRYDRTELSRFGSMGPNLLGSVQREPNSVRSRLKVLFPQLGSDRTETHKFLMF